jgi:NADP-dependent 3-hydroxy acid dehydrogenase YdfG
MMTSMNLSLTDQAFIVTGAAGAIAGSVIAALLDAGAQVLPVDRSSAETRAGQTLTADLGTLEGARAMVGAATARFGRVNGVVHTVGGFAMERADALQPQTLEAMLTANLRTLVNVTAATLPELERTRGFLGGIAAGQAARGAGAGAALYTASKGAAAVYLNSVAAEVKAVRVGVVYPMGTVDTPANRRATPDANPDTWIDPLEVAEAFVYMASRGSRGRVLEVKVYPAA